MTKFHNVTEVHKNIFLSNNDPGFYRKYLHYHPRDSKMLWNYSLELENKKDFKRADEMLNRAVAEGHPLATYKLKEREKASRLQTAQKSTFTPFLWGLLWAAIILFFLLALVGWWRELNHTQNVHITETHYHPKEIFHVPSEEQDNPDNFYSPAQNLSDDTTGQPLQDSQIIETTFSQATVYLSGADWEQIIKQNPPIWFPSEHNQFPAADDPPLTLIFYEPSQLLGLKAGDDLVVTYPVASGKESPSLSKMKVTEKVVEPNGANSALGSRGLQLADNYAIHGTNDPASIGQKVTKGCLRLANEDIEKLYPFISEGTPFVVSQKAPPQNNLSEDNNPASENASLDNLPVIPLKEESLEFDRKPDTVYHWKG